MDNLTIFKLSRLSLEVEISVILKKADKETSENLLQRLISLYEDGKLIGERKNDTEIFREGIKLNAAKARTVVSYLEGVDLLNTDLDSKGRAFETFMGSFFRGILDNILLQEIL